MQETHREPGAVRSRVSGVNLVAEIAREQYGSALFIRDSCRCESISTSRTDNIEIIQATLNGMSINSYYKHPNQAFDFRSQQCTMEVTPKIQHRPIAIRIKAAVSP